MSSSERPVGGGAGEGRARLRELTAEYEIGRELGRGGTAVVYHGVERALDREVAIKVVHAAHVTDAEAVARLAREARLVAQLRHPNIVTLFGTRQLADGSIALIMQYVPGRTLKETIRAEGPLPVVTAERILRELALALQHAHQRQGLVHRDLKPENIYLDEEGGRALLSDFGIARTSDLDSSLTLVGTALGTPAYMSPEQIDGLPLDGRSDLYSLGLVAYEMLTGRQPWAGNNLYSIIYKQKHEELPPLAEFRRDIPPYLERAIAGLLYKDRDRRWTDASRVLAALQPGSGLSAVLPPAITHNPESDRKPVPDYGDDAPTIVYRPGDVARTSGPGGPRDDSRVPASTRRAVEPGAESDAALGALAAAGLGPVSAVRASQDAVFERGDVRHPAPGLFMDSAEPVAERLAAPEVRRVTGRRKRVRVLIGGALFITIAGAMAPFIRADGDRAEDQGPVAEAPPPAVPDGPPDAPARLTVLTDDLIGYVGRPLPVPVGLVVGDAAGRPVAGVSVRLEVVSGDGSVAPSEAVSDSLGLVMTRWTLGERPGPNELRVILANGSGEVAVRARGVAGPVARIIPVRGANQSAPRGSTLQDSIVLRLVDAAGNPVVGQRVTFAVRAGEGTVRPAQTESDSTGRVRTSWTLGSLQEVNTLRVTTASGLSTDIDARGQFRLAPQSRIIAGGTHTCMLAGTGAVSCWGGNEAGQLGAGASAARTGAEVPRAGVPYARLAAGISHTCALDRDGTASCWGANDAGQLGMGDRTARATPSPVRAEMTFSSLTAGLQHTCGLAADGRAWCWGAGAGGQIGDGGNASRPAPARVAGGHEFSRIEAGWRHTCGVTAGGRVFCWGTNADGQLGDGTTLARNGPVAIAGDVRLVDIAAGAAHTCGVTSEGDVYCWGQNDGGQLGTGTRAASSQPVRVQGGAPLVSLVAGAVHTCGLARNGQAYCWGRNNFGQLGNETTQDALAPVPVSGNLRFTLLSASGSHTCGRAASGESYCWGYNVDGQLGDATRSNRTRPQQVSVMR